MSIICAIIAGVSIIYIPKWLDRNNVSNFVEIMIHNRTYDQADLKLADLIVQSPNNWKYINLLARLRIEQNRLEEAYNYIETAEKILKKDNIEILANKVLLYLIKSDYKNAELINSKILKRDKDNLIAISRDFQILNKLKQWDPIISNFDKYIKLLNKKENYNFLIECGMCYYDAVSMKGLDSKKILILTQLIPNSNLSASNLFNLGLIFKKENDYIRLNDVISILESKQAFELDNKYIQTIELWRETLKGLKNLSII